MITSHLKGHFTPIQAAAPIMKAKRYGRIVGFDVGSGRLRQAGRVPADRGPERLIERPGGFTVDEMSEAVVRLFEPMYSSEPRQRPRLVPPAGEQLERLPEGISPLLNEMLSTAGLFPPPDTPPRTAWRRWRT